MENHADRDHLINYKVYIAGQYAPVQEIVLQSGIMSFSEAQVVLFPHKELVDFGENDRVPIHVFYLDTFHGTSPQYRFMFEGEVIDYGYDRYPNSIGMTLSCVSPFEILAQMFNSMFNNIISQANASASNLSSFTSELGLDAILGDKLISNMSDAGITLNSSYSSLFNLETMQARGSSVKGSSTFLRRPYTLFRNILMHLVNGFNIYNDSAKLRSDVSLFFKSFITKRDIMRTMAASPVFEGSDTVLGGPTANLILNAISSSETVNTVTSGLSTLARNIGSNVTVSYWDIIVKMYSIMMYEVLMPLCPPYVKTNIFGTPSESNAKYDTIVNLLTKPSINFGVPCINNTIFPCMISQISYKNSHFTKPTRFFLENASLHDKLVGYSSAANRNVLSNFFINNSSSYYPNELIAETTNQTNIRNSLLWSKTNPAKNEFFKGQVLLQSQRAPDWIDYVKRSVTKNQDTKSKQDGTAETNVYISEIDASAKEVLNLYSKNMYETERASRHSLSLPMRFNPYIVPGFPAAIIENINYGVYFLAMPVSVTHRLSSNGAATTVQFQNIIRFQDAYKNLKPDNYDIGPENPSPQVSQVFNNYTDASFYYNELLFQGFSIDQRAAKKDFIFHPDDYFFMDSETGDISLKMDATFKGYRPGVKKNAQIYMENYESAMKLVSRPVTTLAQFLEFKNKDRYYMNTSGTPVTLSTILQQPHGGVTSLNGPRMFNGEPLYPEVKNKALQKDIKADRPIPLNIPLYYNKILGYTYMNQSKDGVSLFTKKPEDINEYPDFVVDWSSKIKKYREDILSIMQDFYIG